MEAGARVTDCPELSVNPHRWSLIVNKSYAIIVGVVSNLMCFYPNEVLFSNFIPTKFFFKGHCIEHDGTR